MTTVIICLFVYLCYLMRHQIAEGLSKDFAEFVLQSFYMVLIVVLFVLWYCLWPDSFDDFWTTGRNPSP